MSIMFRRIRGRAAGYVLVVNPLLVREIQPTVWGGSEIVYSDVHVSVSRDDPETVQQLLEGRTRLCRTPLCDRTTVTPYSPLCARCGPKASRVSDGEDLVIVNGKHGFA